MNNAINFSVAFSVFIRDCKECKVGLICQQYRTRDCKKIDTFIACVSQPIIEASTGMKFGCLQCDYPELNGKRKSKFVQQCKVIIK